MELREVAKLPAHDRLWIVAERCVALLPYPKQLVEISLLVDSS